VPKILALTLWTPDGKPGRREADSYDEVPAELVRYQLGKEEIFMTAEPSIPCCDEYDVSRLAAVFRGRGSPLCVVLSRATIPGGC
jgi:hypothetical protein